MFTAPRWIWQQPDWPQFHWEEARVVPLLRRVRLHEGILFGMTGTLHQGSGNEVTLDTLLHNMITSSAIENEQLPVDAVRSSLARRMGLSLRNPAPTTTRSEGLANMMMDAITNPDTLLTTTRLLQWHMSLFAGGSQTLYPVNPGVWRGEEPMQVVSGRIDKPKVHFEAPPRSHLEAELASFIQWFNESAHAPLLDPLCRAGICHLWFITLHPFEDGNGRIARALTDMALAQENRQVIRLYAMSATILDRRKDYYRILEHSQRNTTDITDWLVWFLETLEASIHRVIANIGQTLAKSRFWQRFQGEIFSPEQVKVLNRLLDKGEKAFETGISASQYQKITKVSKATATRHLHDLLTRGCVEKLPGGGRNTRYQILGF